jgi:hypothetical protein
MCRVLNVKVRGAGGNRRAGVDRQGEKR